MSSKKFMFGIAYLVFVIVVTIGTFSTGKAIKQYRYEIADKYGLECKWYQKPIFYSKSVKLSWNDVTGTWIIAHNNFDILDEWSGERRSITYDEEWEFEKMQSIHSNWLLLFMFFVIFPATIVILYFVLSLNIPDKNSHESASYDHFIDTDNNATDPN